MTVAITSKRRRRAVAWAAIAGAIVLTAVFVPPVRACLVDAGSLLINGELPWGG